MPVLLKITFDNYKTVINIHSICVSNDVVDSKLFLSSFEANFREKSEITRPIICTFFFKNRKICVDSTNYQLKLVL